MNKLILAACLIALSGLATAQIGLGLGGVGLGVGGVGLGGLGWGGNLGYGLITGLTKVPNLGWGNIGSAVNNININGYQLRTVEQGPRGGRVHNQAQVAPLWGGVAIGAGIGNGILG